jgi:PIN domain nuclease of toxin-antitoxin system
VTRPIALSARTLDVATVDPGDRFIAATAQLGQMSLVTADAALLRFAGCTTIDARS